MGHDKKEKKRAARAAEENGHELDPGKAGATAVTEERVRAADLILTMTKRQREEIELSWPHTRGKVYRLIENDGMDIVDPYRRHRSTFALAFAQIEHGVAYWRRVLAGPAH